MVKVLIVGKTKMGSQLCLGGILLDSGRTVRLLPSRGLGHPPDKPIYLGEVWNMELREVPASEITVPHTEDIRTIRGRRLRRYSGAELLEVLYDCVCIETVHPAELFDSRIRFSNSARGFVSPKDGLPQYSTGFWRFRLPLLKVSADDVTRYWAFDEDGTMLLDVKYVGLENEAPDLLEPGTVLRFSLAHPFLLMILTATVICNSPAGFSKQISTPLLQSTKSNTDYKKDTPP